MGDEGQVIEFRIIGKASPVVARVVEVEGCDVCPMRNFDYEDGETCNHPDETHGHYISGDKTPEWCPLRTAAITYRLKENNVANK